MRNIVWLCTLLLAVACQPVSEITSTGSDQPTIGPTELPFTPLSLDDMSAFQPTASNWSIAGQVLSDHTKEHDITAQPGTGVLINQNNETDKDDLYTNWEHGDLEIFLDFMMPKGSNSGVYFQGRYEVQLLDSWLVDDPTAGDCGGIYERWDESKPEGQKGYEGHAPRLNAAKAPGLWQQFHIIFRAPRFDEAGNKVGNARFEKVVHNGKLIQEDVELFGPTRGAFFEDEAATGPLVIQGDHGPVAFRNIRYKRHFDEPRLELADLHYQYYEIDGPITELPDFDSLQVVKEGTTDSLVYSKLSERNEQVAYVFSGQLQAPKAGDYLFTVYSDDGSQLFINGEMILDNDGKHDYEPKSGLINLTEGSHDFRLTYFNNNWGQGLTVYFEGPEMKRQPLVSRIPKYSRRDRPQLIVEPDGGPEMVRSFVMYKGEKLTHVMSVGDPSGLHYTVDLRRGSLLQFWRGGFADVTEMWYQRGEPQLLQPLAMEVETNAGLLGAELSSADGVYPLERGDALQFKAYDINEVGQPVFQYKVGASLLSDHYQPGEDGRELIRTISVDQGSEELYTRIAADEYITAVGNGYYTVGGNYYIRLLDDKVEPLIRESNGLTEMLFALPYANQEVSYAILW
ncbi:MAG: family 16 glycoside hydrolase [Saprospiraceae bacterium]